ncbi:GNAT family N-acetyltransferase [Microbacterium kyungheense]|uniref:Putative acetyltransferase n=1 Tax=Microbacterium kyungheense TaxID=1263636 RepID=A0A543ERZ3_9MICO|nr:N-acetyltransferase [Microbacterium kyungheense]TQM24351.1 putative acetyltransferase [Microbacterium kyungheense]
MTIDPGPPVHIRPEASGDEDAVRAVTTVAFAPMPFSDGSEPHVIDRLRADGELTLSLVAEDRHGRIIGHIAFSPVVAGGSTVGWYGLGPVSVDPAHQGTGVGRALIEAGLAEMARRGAAGCALIGDPRLYSRFGFVSGALSHEELPPSLVQHLLLREDAAVPVGELRFASAFDHADQS